MDATNNGTGRKFLDCRSHASLKAFIKLPWNILSLSKQNNFPRLKKPPFLWSHSMLSLCVPSSSLASRTFCIPHCFLGRWAQTICLFPLWTALTINDVWGWMNRPGRWWPSTGEEKRMALLHGWNVWKSFGREASWTENWKRWPFLFRGKMKRAETVIIKKQDL